MEAILLLQVQKRLDALSKGHIEARELLAQISNVTEGVYEMDFIGATLRLRQLIELYDKEANRLTPVATSETSVNLLSEGFQVQMEAEATLTNMTTYERCLKEKATPNQEIPAPGSTTRLPKLEPTKFSGDILRFTEFWDKFESNIGSKTLRNVDKMAYLVSSLEGRARETVEGLPVTNENYFIAVDTLKTRYGSKDRVVDAHYKEITNMLKCSDNAEEALRSLDNIERHLRVLQSLGENIESNHLRSIIMEKFPERILYEVNVRLTGVKSVSDIRDILRTVLTAMESSQSKFSAATSPSTPITTSTEALYVKTSDKPTKQKFNERRQQRSLSSDAASFNKRDRKRKLDRDTQVPNKLTKRACIFCDEDHYNDECGKFKDIQARRKQLKERCFNCFGNGHQARECKRLIRCHHCAGPHNRSLCPTKNSRAGNDKPNDPVTTAMSKHVFNSTSFLQTATVRVLSEKKLPLCRVLLDSGSQRSYITTSLAKHLNLTPDEEDLLMIFTFGSEKPAETLSPSANITIETKRGVQKLIRVNIVPHITDRIAVPNVSHSDLVDVLADDGSGGQGVDILIGNDYYFSFIGNEKIMIDDHLHLVNTDFGWIVSGRLEQQERREVTLSVVTYHQSGCEFSHYSEPDLPLRNLDIKFLWTLENIGITDSVKATREEEVVQHFNNTIKYQNGRYYVKWPWTQSHPSLPTNYGPAYGRLKGLLLRADKATLNEYNNILQEQIQANIIEIVEPESDTTCQTTPTIHYLPHHIVKQAGKRGRIVYDASAKSKDHLSLNECLYRGPCLLQDLTALLVNFRINKIGILADVEKAFLQVGLQTEDRDVTRFLWVKNIEEPLTYDNILHLRFCRVPFGIISSPFLLNAVIRYHISTTNPDLLGSIADRCYVDNLVTGANTTEDAVKLFEETKNLFQQLSMNIRDWTSNNYTLMEKIPMKSRAKQTEKTKVLGLVWNKEEDTLRLNLKDNILDPSEVTNKRQVLRVLASIYDPCGFVAPLLLPVKLFLQELWRRGYKWDTPLSPELHEEWGKISSTLYDVKDCTLPRYTGFHSCENERNIEYELHCFTDASNHGYATVAYLRADDGRNVKTTLLMSKTRIAPLEKKKGDKNESTSKAHTSPPKNKKPLTIPQMELLGYLIGSRLIAYLKKTLVLHISKQYLWTDSLVVLSWVKSNKLLPPFVANRVDEIKQNGDVENCYINSRLNPADLATRPELWHQKKHTWLQGPDFLLANKKMWPNDRHLEDHLSTLSAVVEGLEEQPPDFTEESDRKEAERDMAEAVEDNLNMNRPEMPLIDTMAEQTNNMDSEVREIKEIQSRYFPEEVEGKDSHLTRNLGLFMDVDGLLRCGGRMMHADMAYDTKHPILLPRECEYTTKVIRETHEKNYHVGVPHTLSIIRQKYWIPKGRAQVQKVLRRCPECIKHGGGPYKLPTTPALPPERVKYSAPYAFLGMDYFGPMMVKCESGNEKRWICLFTCLVVRAVHLEVVKNLTAEECLLALRRFVASRGVPTLILSDNALQFKLTSELLTSTFCVEKKIKWRFIPQLAPWHGGVYERLVGVVKHCLKRTLSKHLLGDSGLQTVIKEVEAVVNTRPLTCVGADIEYVLKPADFLSLGKCLTMNFSRDITINSDTLTKRDLIEGWKRGQNIIDEFKEMFIGQYLPSLRERYKNNVKQPRVTTGKTPRVGDIVQIKSEAKNRQNWKVGKITSLVRSEDGECRVARVRVGNTEFTRSVGHLYPLEADMDDVTELDVPSEPILTETHDSREPVIQETTPVVSSPRKIQEQPMDLDLIKGSSDKPNEKEVVIQESEVGEREISNPEKDNKDSEVVEQLTLPSSESRDDSEEMEIHNESDLSETQEVKVRRVAAVKAREKIAEWTRQLFALL